jgi:hypothetical protein
MCVGLALVLMLTIFHHSKAKFFCLASFLARKKNEACHLANVFFVSARKLAKQKVFALG